jgi:hypothetical protein
MLSHPEPSRNKCDISPSRPRDVVLVEAAQVEIAASARRQPGSLAAHSRFRNRPQPLAAKAGRPQYNGHFPARPNRASLLASWLLPVGSIQKSQTKSAARPDSRKLSTIGRRNTAPASLLLEAEKGMRVGRGDRRLQGSASGSRTPAMRRQRRCAWLRWRSPATA